MTDRAIADYAFLGDCHGAALVSRDGSVDWLCLPRFDSPSVLGRLLDDDAGHWSLRPTGAHDVRRRYLDGTLVLETTFDADGGTMVVVDALVVPEPDQPHHLGAGAPHALVRRVSVTSGEVELEGELCARPEYGLVRPNVVREGERLVVRGGATVLTVDGPPAEIDGGVACWSMRLGAGDTVTFTLARHDRDRPADEALPPGDELLDATVRAWEAWTALHEAYEGPHRDLVRHSGRVLQALTYQPTGAVVAAPTTSLAETPGGRRNYDYRYAWVRDASLTVEALWVAACPDEAGTFLDFLIETAGVGVSTDCRLQIVYGVAGEHDLSERELDHLSGWRGSRPVRVGNAAWSQDQLDVHGELLDAVRRYQDRLDRPTGASRDFLVAVADAAANGWTEPDSGIWERRGERRHHVHSKVMCWVALDRAAAMADWLGVPDRRDGWRRTAEEIRQTVVSHGWNDELQSYTDVLDGDTVDAALLQLGISGFLAADDPRLRSTVRRIQRDVSAPCGLLYRNRRLRSAGEGTFVLCSYWLVESLVLLGELQEASDLFDRITSYVNDVGLIAEEVDPETGEQLGNAPQAFSHIGLVNAAWALRTA